MIAEQKKAEPCLGLCFRCEFRAQFLERGHAPRFECGQITSTKYSCYQYKPCRLVIVQRDSGDRRPLGGLCGARFHTVGYDDGGVRALNIAKRKKAPKYLLYRAPSMLITKMEKPNGKNKKLRRNSRAV